MNCKQVQELLPLYIGRDLEEKRGQRVTAHIQSCVECAGAADEYRETRQLLQQFAPPTLSKAVYNESLQRIGHKNERKTTATTLPNFVKSMFRPPLRWAVATALLVIVSVFAIYFVVNRMSSREQVADGYRRKDGLTTPSIKEGGNPSPANLVQNGGGAQRTAGHIHQPQRRKSTAAATDRARSLTANNAETRSTTVETSRGLNPADPNAASDRDSTTSERPLRMEMQTKDPNIRIIWFAHQPTKPDSPGKFSKGT
jgi:hypothetical protein